MCVDVVEFVVGDMDEDLKRNARWFAYILD